MGPLRWSLVLVNKQQDLCLPGTDHHCHHPAPECILQRARWTKVAVSRTAQRCCCGCNTPPAVGWGLLGLERKLNRNQCNPGFCVVVNISASWTDKHAARLGSQPEVHGGPEEDPSQSPRVGLVPELLNCVSLSPWCHFLPLIGGETSALLSTPWASKTSSLREMFYMGDRFLVQPTKAYFIQNTDDKFIIKFSISLKPQVY